MKVFLFLSFLLNLLKLIKNHQILTVNKEDFNKINKENKNIAIYFHAPWSNESVYYKKYFEKLPFALNKKYEIKFLEILSKEQELVDHFNIIKFPSIILIRNEQVFIYEGELKTNHFVFWIEK